MPHIALPEGLPGIRGAMAFRPETAKPLNDLVEVLLRGPNTLTPGERELIATYVSSLNDCYYCQTIHGAIAAAHLNGDEDLVRRVKADFQHANISEKLKALLVIAAKVQRGGKNVTAADVEHARSVGATRRGDSRHGPDRRGLLHVQPLCRRPGHHAASRRSAVSRARQAGGARGICSREQNLFAGGAGRTLSDPGRERERSRSDWSSRKNPPGFRKKPGGKQGDHFG